jgi:hypothetical protein
VRLGVLTDPEDERVESFEQFQPHRLQALGSVGGPLIDSAEPLILLCESPVHPFEALEDFTA